MASLSMGAGRPMGAKNFHYATPDFLLRSVALSNFMRLSLLKAAHAVVSSAAWQEIRVRSVEKHFQERSAGTADPSASPGFPVESCGFDQLHVVLFRENHISGAGESCEVGNPEYARDDKGEGGDYMEGGGWTEAVSKFNLDRSDISWHKSRAFISEVLRIEDLSALMLTHDIIAFS